MSESEMLGTVIEIIGFVPFFHGIIGIENNWKCLVTVIEILKILVEVEQNDLQQLRILYVCCSAL